MSLDRRHLTLAGLLLAVACLPSCQRLTDMLDQHHLERHFGIPPEAQLLAYRGFPPMVGFGQREGLHVSAVYWLPLGPHARFVREAPARGWEPLPIPPAVLRKGLVKGLRIPLEIRRGLYFCRTAGDDVLRATRTTPCASVEEMHDIILGVLDAETRLLSVAVRAGY